MAVAMTLPIVIGVNMDLLQVAINITLGVILVSPCDVYGNIRLKVVGMLLAGLLAVVVTFIASFLNGPVWLLLPLLGALIFGISYLSIYGFRASLISFSGLFTLVLCFSSLSESGLSVYERMLWVAVGVVWYVGLTLLRHLIFPKGPTEFHLSETLRLTADYLETRAQLIDSSNNRSKLLKKLFELQTKLTDNHENLRELLIVKRKGFGKSAYQAKRLLVFSQLVDMFELAMANSVNYYKTDHIFKERPEQLEDFQEVLFAMSSQLKHIAAFITKPYRFKKSQAIINSMAKIQTDIESLKAEKNNQFDEEILMLINYWKYQKNQMRKIAKIEWLLDHNTMPNLAELGRENPQHFLTKQNYNIKLLQENFNKQSIIFRHSIRIAIVSMIGYGIGLVLHVENAYWILLTLIVIMRPNFGLTKTRFKQRTLGTVFGGVLTFAIIMVIRDTTFYAVMGIVCFVIGFSMVQRNYKAAATFITMHVLFTYALLRTDVFSVIQFRVLDTLIGAGLAFASNLLFWPAWEIKSIDSTLKSTLKANRDYLEEIAQAYNKKDDVSDAYKLSRKQAFLAFSDLSSSFQRMTQEPKRRQKNADAIYRIVMLHNSFMASLASLGTYISHNQTTKASEMFNETTREINSNLLLAEKILNNYSLEQELRRKAPVREQFLNPEHQGELKPIPPTSLENKLDAKMNTEEGHLVYEQLKWLLSMSKKIPKLLAEIEFENK